MFIISGQMKEFLEGSGGFWYTSQRAICSACTTWKQYVHTAVNVFFSKEVLKKSGDRGLKKRRKLDDTIPLCQPVIDAIIGKFILYSDSPLFLMFIDSVSIALIVNKTKNGK